jgi:hypothetical protein
VAFVWPEVFAGLLVTPIAKAFKAGVGQDLFFANLSQGMGGVI